MSVELLVLHKQGLRWGIPGHYGLFEEHPSFEAALAAARGKLAAGHARQFVVLRIEARTLNTAPAIGTHRALVSFEIYPDRVVLVPPDKGGMSDEQRDQVLALVDGDLV